MDDVDVPCKCYLHVLYQQPYQVHMATSSLSVCSLYNPRVHKVQKEEQL